MNKKPKIFKPDMDFIDTNKKAFYSYSSNNNFKIDVREFLDNLSLKNSYVFNKRVVIKTKDNVYDTRIAGKLGNRLITMDNTSINIDDIVEIYEKK